MATLLTTEQMSESPKARTKGQDVGAGTSISRGARGLWFYTSLYLRWSVCSTARCFLCSRTARSCSEG